MTYSIRSLVVAAAGLACATPIFAQEILQQIPGDAGNDRFGSRIVSADLDGDGVVDHVVTAPWAGAAMGGGVLARAGRVRAVSGADGATLWQRSGVVAEGRFGWAIAGVADTDGDGIEEILVGAPGLPGSTDPGSASLLSGADGATLWVALGTDPGGQYGFSVAGTAPILTDDGPGVVIGAPLEDAAGMDSGAVHLLAGDTGAVLAVVPGDQAGDNFGHAVGGVAPADMLTDDGPGVVIGAPFGGPDDEGTTTLYKHEDLTVAWSQTGDVNNDRSGVSLAVIGDVDDDGVADIAVGSEPVGDAAAPRAGRVLVISGADGSVLATHVADKPGTGFGRVVTAVGDVDADGVPDLGVSEPDSSGHLPGAGCVRIYAGSDGELLHRVYGGEAGAELGAALTAAGDTDGDGHGEVVVGAPGLSGSAFVISLGNWDNLRAGLPGVNGIPDLTGQSGGLGEEIRLTLTGARETTAAALVIGSATAIDPVHGVLSPLPDLVVDGLVTNAQGEVECVFEWPEGLLMGEKIYYQFRIVDAAAPGGESRSNALAGVL